MLRIENLSAEVSSQKILKNINLTIEENSIVVLFGPNGSGKSTLIHTIMGFNGYKIIEGDIFFKGKSIKDLSTEKRAQLGIGVMFQRPPKIKGISLKDIAYFLSSQEEEIQDLSQRLNLKGLLHRDLNYDFSGGEIKRSELFQVILQKPKLLLLDEPESGVDLENISIMGGVLSDYLKEYKVSSLIITHTGYILDYIKAEKGCVMIDGELICVGHPQEIFESIRRFGYERCKECQWRK
ncbi:MAG: ABC transporter ATP-binding protein [Candidatus Omnitrophota bacterium]|nr:MAG: ABC transporter ATP-binding protein [Candidatus Omnitrophota bacterium]